VYGKKFFSFLLEGEGAQESGLYEKSCIDELSNYLGGCMGNRIFYFFLKVRGARGRNVLKKCINDMSNSLGGCIEKKKSFFLKVKGVQEYEIY
jgi:hypothetical protein